MIGHFVVFKNLSGDRTNLVYHIFRESNTTVTQEQLPSSSHSSQTKCQKERVKFRKVSPYPSDGEVDDSDILSTSQHTPIDTEGTDPGLLQLIFIEILTSCTITTVS